MAAGGQARRPLHRKAVVPAAAGDDAVDARWVRCADMDTLIRDLAGHGAELYEAHRPLLQRALAAL